MARGKKNDSAGAVAGSQAGAQAGSQAGTELEIRDGIPVFGTELDFDDFCAELRTYRNRLDAQLIAVNHNGGYRMGDVDVEPVDTLEARCRATFATTARVTVALRARRLSNKRVAFVGRLPIEARESPTPSPSSSSSSGDDAVSTLSQQVRELTATVVKLSSSTPPAPRESMAEQANAFSTFAGVLQPFIGAGSKSGAPGLDIDTVRTLVGIGEKLGAVNGAASAASTAATAMAPAASVFAEHVAPALGRLLEVTGGHLVTSLVERKEKAEGEKK